MQVAWGEKSLAGFFCSVTLSHIMLQRRTEATKVSEHPSHNAMLIPQDPCKKRTKSWQQPFFTFCFPYTKSWERHRHSLTEALAPEGCSDSAPDVLLKPSSFWSQPWSCRGKLHVLYLQGQDTALDDSALPMDSFTPCSTSFTFSFLFYVACSSRARCQTIHIANKGIT